MILQADHIGAGRVDVSTGTCDDVSTHGSHKDVGRINRMPSHIGAARFRRRKAQPRDQGQCMQGVNSRFTTPILRPGLPSCKQGCVGCRHKCSLNGPRAQTHSTIYGTLPKSKHVWKVVPLGQVAISLIILGATIFSPQKGIGFGSTHTYVTAPELSVQNTLPRLSSQ